MKEEIKDDSFVLVTLNDEIELYNLETDVCDNCGCYLIMCFCNMDGSC